jgi:competence protein ComEA
MGLFGKNKRREVYWKQKLYFLTDRLGMSRNESRLILFLTVGTLAGALYLVFRSPRQEELPADLKASFEERNASLAALKDKLLQERYYPEEENENETEEESRMTNAESDNNSDESYEQEETHSQETEESTLKININTADKNTLEKLSGVGPVTADLIITFREQYGAFKSVDELTKIKGIGPKTLEELVPHIILND